MIPKVKVCCISSIEEASMAIKYGASALGLVGHMPSGPGVIPDDKIAKISATIPPPIASFLLTSETKKENIVAHHKKVSTNTIQLVDNPERGTYTYLRDHLSGIKIVQVLHIINESSIDDALRVAEHVDAILLDSGNPSLDTKILGGTGKIHNWEISRKIVAQVPIPVFLAGGLRTENVKKAIDEVQPFGLDLCTGVRTNGNLDPRKLEAFFKAVYK